MTSIPRYAIYYAPLPGSDLERFGAHMLGYDALSGEELPFHPGVAQQFGDWRDLTRNPRKYGFHATLKAPMALISGKTENELLETCERFANQARPIPVIKPIITSIGGFIAVVPAKPSIEMMRLASDCTREFDLFRKPLTPVDRARRNPSALTPRQRDYLDCWGYPYVMEDFRFHMTLTGNIAAERHEEILGALRKSFAALELATLVIDRIAVFRQDSADYQFKILRHYALRNVSAITSMKSMGPPGV